MIGRFLPEEERPPRRLTTQQAFPRSAIFTFSLRALRGSSGLRMKSEALNAETATPASQPGAAGTGSPQNPQPRSVLTLSAARASRLGRKSRLGGG